MITCESVYMGLVLSPYTVKVTPSCPLCCRGTFRHYPVWDMQHCPQFYLQKTQLNHPRQLRSTTDFSVLSLPTNFILPLRFLSTSKPFQLWSFAMAGWTYGHHPSVWELQRSYLTMRLRCVTIYCRCSCYAAGEAADHTRNFPSIEGPVPSCFIQVSLSFTLTYILQLLLSLWRASILKYILEHLAAVLILLYCSIFSHLESLLTLLERALNNANQSQCLVEVFQPPHWRLGFNFRLGSIISSTTYLHCTVYSHLICLALPFSLASITKAKRRHALCAIWFAACGKKAFPYSQFRIYLDIHSFFLLVFKSKLCSWKRAKQATRLDIMGRLHRQFNMES